MSVVSSGTDNLGSLLDLLPYAVEYPSDGCISGLLLKSEPGTVRIVVGGHCLTFELGDIQDICRLDAEGELEGRSEASMVRLMLRLPTKLLGVEVWAEFQQTSFATRPFAFATRAHPIVAPANPEFRARERAFCLNIKEPPLPTAHVHDPDSGT